MHQTINWVVKIFYSLGTLCLIWCQIRLGCKYLLKYFSLLRQRTNWVVKIFYSLGTLCLICCQIRLGCKYLLKYFSFLHKIINWVVKIFYSLGTLCLKCCQMLLKLFDEVLCLGSVYTSDFEPRFVMSRVLSFPLKPGNTKGGSITVLLTSFLTGLESAVWQLTIVVFICQRD